MFIGDALPLASMEENDSDSVSEDNEGEDNEGVVRTHIIARQLDNYLYNH